jgi:hypothetical protein
LRAALQRKGLVFYGLRTTEPHHDATPHWNVLFFSTVDDAEAIAQEFDRYFLFSDSPDEPGASVRRVRCKEMDPDKGDATSYVAKYISKGIDGVGVGVDQEDGSRGRDARDTILLGFGARRHDVDYRHVTKVGIISIVEAIRSDESLKILDVCLPALRVVAQRVREDGSGDPQVLPSQAGALQAKVAISRRRVQPS